MRGYDGPALCAVPVREWRKCFRIVPELSFSPVSYAESDEGPLLITEVSNCNCAPDYKFAFLQHGVKVLEVGVVHLWWVGHVNIRCKQINLGSDTTLTRDSAEALRAKLRSLGEKPPVFD